MLAIGVVPESVGLAVSDSFAHQRPALGAARLAVLAVFFTNGVVIGSWVVRIPAIKGKLDLSDGLLGVVLLAAAQPFVALAGFACAGFSIIFPMALSAAGRTEGPTGPALAAVTTAAYTGFLIGPPFIGFLAELTGLGYALYLVVALSAAVLILAGAVNTGAAKAK